MAKDCPGIISFTLSTSRKTSFKAVKWKQSYN